ncbi:hypothetical protein ACP4OV_013151 [Aristida adscensionis]
MAEMAASMAKAIALVLFVCVLLCHEPRGSAVAKDQEPCLDTDLKITTAATGRVAGGQPEFRVTVENRCACALSGVVLSCLDGLPSTEPVNRTAIHLVGNDGDLCLVYNGWPITKGSPVTFTYAWNTTLGFTMYNADPRC